MKRLLILLLATVFAVNIFFGSWSEFRDWVQAFAKDLREFVVDVATDKDWWRLKSTPTPAKTETREIDLGGSGVIRKSHKVYLKLDENGWHQWDWIEWRDGNGKLLKVEGQPVDENGNPIDLKPGK